jgi:hypothetical protein
MTKSEPKIQKHVILRRQIMKAKVVDWDKELKKRIFKDKVKDKIQGVKCWVIRNKDTLIYLTPIIVTGITTVVKVVGRRVNLHKAESIKNLYCYDRSLGHYWRLRRELSNREWLEIDSRKKNGERLADILSEMKVLK